MSTELVEKICQLKNQRKAVILAHNYQAGDVQDIADFVGDSLGLSKEAARTDAEVIVFCGVHFMAETAAILSPDKTVLLPDKHAGCPMADMITAEQLQQLKNEHPEAMVVSYVNSTARVKALSDYCCTSGNAVELVNSLETGKEIIFVPDKYLGGYVNEQTGRDMILWPGYCPTHALISADEIKEAKSRYPDAVVMAHPECPKQVRDCADEIHSTSGMLNFAKKSGASRFIVATEKGIIHTLRKQNPGKEFFVASVNAVCPNMKKINLEKVLWSLEDMEHKITVAEDISTKAKAALDRMLAVLPSK
ncbi:MAG: quinolinate synthase NadA [Planctomycetota bacterium]